MSNEAAGPWPSWDELFGSPPGTPPGDGTPPPFTPPTRDDMPDYLRDRFSGGAGLGMYESRPDDALGWNVGGQPDRAPAPDPLMAPAGMVVNPYYYLPGNAEYIPQAQYDTLMADQDQSNFGYVDGSVVARPRFDAYDATLQTYGDPAKLGYDPGGAWQRENDYTNALVNRGELSRLTAGNYTERRLGNQDGREVYAYRSIPQGFDTREGAYYREDGTVSTEPDGRYSPTGDLFVTLSPEERKMMSRGQSPLDYVLSSDVSQSQPRGDTMGRGKMGGTLSGSVIGPGDAAYDLLRGVSPAILSNGAIDPNPFRGPVGTSTAFRAEDGDAPSSYPGVSFYEATADGQFKKVTALTPGKEYYAVRESYDFEGFAENPTMKNADPGTVFQIRTGNSVNGTKVSSFSKDYNILSIYNPETKEKYTLADIESGAHGDEPGVIPGGWGVVISKTGTPVEEAIVAGEDNMGVAAAAYNMEGPESVAAMMRTGIGKRFTEAGFSVGSDGLLVRQTPAISTEPPPETTVGDSPTSPPSGPTSPADFQTQMKTYIGGSLRSVTEGRVTFVPGENRSSYPTYAGTPYEDIGGKGWVVPVAASTTGASIAELKDLGATVYKNNGIDKKTGLVDWVSVSSGDIKEGVEYVMVFTNSEVRTILGVK